MVDDEKKPEPERSKSEAPEKEEATDPVQEYLDALDKLNERARARGVNPAQLLASAYLRRGLGVAERFLSALEEGSKKT